MVSKEMPDPIGTEFGMVSDELTYGSDLETAMRNLFFRIGTDDLPLFVTAVAIQRSTAATSAKFSKTCHPLFVNASRCGEKFGPWPRKAVLRH
jgi:hypothetical protein